MDLATISGVYENSRKILRILGGNQNLAGLQARLKVLAENPKSAKELEALAVAIDHLEDHLRVMGMEEVVKI